MASASTSGLERMIDLRSARAIRTGNHQDPALVGHSFYIGSKWSWSKKGYRARRIRKVGTYEILAEQLHRLRYSILHNLT